MSLPDERVIVRTGAGGRSSRARMDGWKVEDSVCVEAKQFPLTQRGESSHPEGGRLKISGAGNSQENIKRVEGGSNSRIY